MQPHLEQQAGEAIVQLGEQAMFLSPGKRMAIGFAVAATGAVMFFDRRGEFLPVLPVGLVAAGAVIAISALRARRALQLLERQLEEVVARWDELAAGMQAETAAGRSAVRYLQAAGITRFEARQFALRRFRGDQPVEARRRDVAAQGPSAAFLPQHSRPRPPDAPGPGWLPRG